MYMRVGCLLCLRLVGGGAVSDEIFGTGRGFIGFLSA